MPVATARFDTRHAARYVQQMCKHFAHKVAVEQVDGEGRFALPPGPAQIVSDESGLTIRAEAADAEGLARSKHILESHLLRFAFREEPRPLSWQEGTPRTPRRRAFESGASGR